MLKDERAVEEAKRARDEFYIERGRVAETARGAQGPMDGVERPA